MPYFNQIYPCILYKFHEIFLYVFHKIQKGNVLKHAFVVKLCRIVYIQPVPQKNFIRSHPVLIISYRSPNEKTGQKQSYKVSRAIFTTIFFTLAGASA